MMITDVTSRELKVGQKVAYNVPHYKWLEVDVVYKVTPCGVTLATQDRHGKRLNRQGCQVCIIGECE